MCLHLLGHGREGESQRGLKLVQGAFLPLWVFTFFTRFFLSPLFSWKVYVCVRNCHPMFGPSFTLIYRLKPNDSHHTRTQIQLILPLDLFEAAAWGNRCVVLNHRQLYWARISVCRCGRERDRHRHNKMCRSDSTCVRYISIGYEDMTTTHTLAVRS